MEPYIALGNVVLGCLCAQLQFCGTSSFFKTDISETCVKNPNHSGINVESYLIHNAAGGECSAGMLYMHCYKFLNLIIH